jgi:hypothetical protein
VHSKNFTFNVDARCRVKCEGLFIVRVNAPQHIVMFMRLKFIVTAWASYWPLLLFDADVYFCRLGSTENVTVFREKKS